MIAFFPVSPESQVDLIGKKAEQEHGWPEPPNTTSTAILQARFMPPTKKPEPPSLRAPVQILCNGGAGRWCDSA